MMRSFAMDCKATVVFPVFSSKEESDAKERSHPFRVLPVLVKQRGKAQEALRIVKSYLAGVPYAFYYRHRHAPMLKLCTEMINNEDISVIWLDHIDSFQYVDFSRNSSGRSKVVLDMHNCYTSILNRIASNQRTAVKKMLYRFEAARMAKIEKRAVQLVDGVVAVSDIEAEHFRSLGARRVWTAPNGVDYPAFSQINRNVDTNCPNIIFVGSMDWQPNIDSVDYLARSILPKVRFEFPNATLSVVGKSPTPAVLSLQKLPGVLVTGTVQSVLPYMEKATIQAIPMESGGGTRLKVLESFAAGVPIVSTPIGIEGVDAVHGQHAWICESSEMADAIVSLCRKPMLLEQMMIHAKLLAEQKYDWSSIGRKCLETLKGW